MKNMGIVLAESYQQALEKVAKHFQGTIMVNDPDRDDNHWLKRCVECGDYKLFVCQAEEVIS